MTRVKVWPWTEHFCNLNNLKKAQRDHFNGTSRSVNKSEVMSHMKVLAFIATTVVTLSCATSLHLKSESRHVREAITFDATSRNNQAELKFSSDKKFSKVGSEEEDDSSIPARSNVITNNLRNYDRMLLSNPSDAIQFRTRSADNPIFFTKAQVDNHLKFPNDTINPKNRLQTEPTEEEKDLIQKFQAASSPSSSGSAVSAEQSQFFAEEENVSTTPATATLPDRKDEINTLHLTLEIMRKSLWKDENAVFSPLSICNVLALLLLGSKGRTQMELASVLNIGDNLESEMKNQTYHATFKNLLNLLKKKSGEGVTLEIANQVFTDITFPLEESYVQNSTTFYDAQVKSLDFGTDGKAFQDEVNEWVRTKTNGKINSIIDEPPSPSTTLAFVNAVYFKGNWEVPFVERVTRKRSFYVNSNESLDVQMMMSLMTIPFADHEHYQIAAIPYKGNHTGFFVILPKPSNNVERTGLQDLLQVEQNLTGNSLREMIQKMRHQKVAMKLPKMKINTDGHMKDILTNIGVPSIFEPTLADFSKISSSRGLYVSAVHHKAVIEVNEKGTEAAAVTVGTSDRNLDEIPIPFNVNKPFIFFLYNIKQETVLFWGRVTRPK